MTLKTENVAVYSVPCQVKSTVGKVEKKPRDFDSRLTKEIVGTFYFWNLIMNPWCLKHRCVKPKQKGTHDKLTFETF